MTGGKHDPEVPGRILGPPVEIAQARNVAGIRSLLLRQVQVVLLLLSLFAGTPACLLPLIRQGSLA